jgi:2-haloacid dehalogenase
MNSNQAIVFDLGGVLIDWNPRYLYRKLFENDDSGMEKFLLEVCTSDWNAQQDEGRPLAEATAQLVDRFPDQEPLIRAFYDRWPEMVGGAFDGTVEILAELKHAGRRLYALSNWSAETFPHARHRFSFFDWFDHLVISGQIQMVKPNRDIFDHLLEKAGRRPGECTFIDDSLVNINAAAELGFDAIHFQSPEALRVELTSRGLLANRR